MYAAREKNGVYIPKERYYQEENERKVGHLCFVLIIFLFFLLAVQEMSGKKI